MHRIQSSSVSFIHKIIQKDLVEGKCKSVHTRFAPQPNGYLHLGHAKSICLNFGIAKDYNGHCNLRFDDTNPIQENIEYIESIQYDIKWLGFNWSGRVHYSSDYFDQLYNYAIELINKGLAYVDQLSLNMMRAYRGTLTIPGKNSPYRNQNIEENRSLFIKMRNGFFPEGSVCLRAKIDMKSPFIILRDPVLYRIKFLNHHQTGNKWCIYPTYDFTHCIADALEGITHSLCTLEFQDNRRLYDWILSNISINIHPKQYEFSRLNMEYTVMSKRKLNVLVQKKIVQGWDDPRLPTLSGLRRKGYTASAIREFCNRIGITKQENTVEISSLDSCIREELNEYSIRIMAVMDPIRLIIQTLPEQYEHTLVILNHPNKPEMGTRHIIFNREIYIDRSDFSEHTDVQYKRLKLGQEVRLRHAFVIKAKSIQKDQNQKITTIFCCHDPNTLNKHPSDGRKIQGVIHWVSAVHNVVAKFNLYDRLFNVVHPASEVNFLEMINSNSMIIKYGVIESEILKIINTNKYFQFEREGYFCMDVHHHDMLKYISFNRIVSLRKTYNKKIHRD